MATASTNALRYFTVDCVDEDKIEFLIAKHGPEGYGLLVLLWKKIYGMGGYLCDWKERNIYLFAKDRNTSVELLKEVVNTCFDEEIFSREMYQTHEILTSNGVQKRWTKIVREAKRKDTEIVPKFRLFSNTPEKNENTPEKSTKTPEFDPQSKVKKSKENKSRRKEGESAAFYPPDFDEFFEFFSAAGFNRSWAKKSFDHYDKMQWVDKYGHAVTDWQKKAKDIWMKDSDRTPENLKQVTRSSPGQTQKSAPDPEPDETRQIAIYKNLIAESFAAFPKRGVDDSGNLIFKNLYTRFAVTEFVAMWDGARDRLIAESRGKIYTQQAKPAITSVKDVFKTRTENNGIDMETKIENEAKKTAVREFYTSLWETDIQIINLIA